MRPSFFRQGELSRTIACVLLAIAAIGVVSAANRADDQKTLADLDTQYQRAVEKNDTKTMARILAEDFILVLGDGTVHRFLIDLSSTPATITRCLYGCQVRDVY